MIEAIRARLKTGSITQVIEFGEERPAPARGYVVIKDEGSTDGGKSFRLIAHLPVGDNDRIRRYVQKELSDLLVGQILTDSEGNSNELLITGETTGIITGNDDGTLSMERVFLLPGFEF